MTVQTASRIALGLGALSVVAMLAGGLALQDIYQGETDLMLEWRVLRISSVVILAFHVFALTAAWKAAGFPIDKDG